MTPGFEYYALDFKGRVIPDEQMFLSVLTEAAAYVDAMICNNRQYLETGGNLNKYYNAICAVAEEIYKQAAYDEGRQKQSESVGNHSVSYSTGKTSAEREDAKRRKVQLFLAGTGLLYRGMPY